VTHAGDPENPFSTSEPPDAPRRPVQKQLWLPLAGAIALVAGVHLAVSATLPGSTGLVTGLIDAILVVGVGAPMLWQLVVRPHLAALDHERWRNEQERQTLAAQTAVGEFDAKLHRAFEIAHTEGEVTALLQRVLGSSMEGCAAELLLAESSDAPLKRMVAVAGRQKSPPQCPVASAGECVAARQGQTLVFSSSDEIDACPKLANRPHGPCTAVCVPVAVSGRSIGVLHATRPLGQSFSARQGLRLGAIAELVGHRLGILRAMEKSRLQSAVDGLTGVLNRRGFETRAHPVVAGGERYAVVVCDLDQFKLLNEKHGLEAGNQALRLFARTLKGVFRSEDIVAHFGGGEFVVFVPGAGTEAAVQMTARVRSALAEALLSGNTPLFTSSFGVADSTHGEALEDIVNAAIGALSAAKRGGRDCARIAGSSPPVATTGGDAVKSAQPAQSAPSAHAAQSAQAAHAAHAAQAAQSAQPTQPVQPTQPTQPTRLVVQSGAKG
jgi:diguanylate cyclase (GGDEF)-like protein